MSNIEVEIISDSRARIYNKEYKAIASELDISIEKAKQLLKDGKAALVLRDKQKIDIEVLKDYMNYCKVILRSNTEACILGFKGTGFTTGRHSRNQIDPFRTAAVYNDGKTDIIVTNDMVAVFEDDIKYLGDAMYCMDGSSGDIVITSKRSAGGCREHTEYGIHYGSLTVEQLKEISIKNVVIQYSTGRSDQNIIVYASKDDIKKYSD